MADDRLVTELIVTGAQESVRQILSVAAATSGLVTTTETSGVRQRVAYDSVAVAAQRSAEVQASAAKHAADAIRQAEESSTKTIVAEAAKQANARRTAAQAANSRTLASRSALGSGAPLGGLLDRIVDAQAQTGVLNRIKTATDQVTTASTKKNQVLNEQSGAHSKNASSGITYLSVLSAIHAASFLATNQTFSMIGSFTTLGLAFSKLGPLASAVGLAFGGFLAIFGAVSNAMEQIQQVAIGLVETLAKVGVGVVVAATAAAGASIGIAANVETQLASVRAFGGATTDQLRTVADQAVAFGRQFGVSIASVVEATSLFARAGGTVADAINGATEAIIKLQVASAGELSAAQAALAVSAALKQFNLAGEEATRVADNLAAAAQGSALSFTGVTQAFIQAVPGARSFGLSIEDLAGGIALLGDQLVKGTITGTSFKQFLISLVNPSKESQAEMAKLGISIQDSSGKIRPFIDIANDLNKALGEEAVATGRITQVEAVRATNVIFSSRAVLAANILSREGADAIARYNDELSKVTTNNIVQVLLLPLNKQLEILRTNLEATGNAFGGALLGPARTVITGVIKLFEQLIPIAQLAGQAVAVIISGQGFGELQAQISKIADNQRVAIFLIELVNSFRNVRDVITGQIIPAIQDFVTNLGLVGSEPGRLTDTVTAFQNINRAIQLAGAVIAGFIRQLSILITQMVHNEGEGAKLRDIISAIALTLVTNLVTSIVTTTAFLVIAAKVMEGMADTIRTKILPNIANFGKALIILGRIAQEVVTLIRAPIEAMAAIVAFSASIESGQGLDKALENAKDAANRAKGPIHAVGVETENLGDALVALAQKGESGVAGIDSILADARKSASDTVASFVGLGGKIPDALANIAADIAETQRAAATGLTGSMGVEPPPLVDPKAVEAATKKIEEAGRDLSRRLANLAEDSATRVANIVARSLERLDDIQEKTITALSKLARDTKERIDEIQEAVFQRRDDRQATDAFSKLLEDRQRVFEREQDAEARAADRLQDHIRTARSRGNEDVQRSVDQAFAIIEKGYTRQQDAAERAFQHIQQARERAADIQDQIAETQFSREQDRVSTERDNQLKLANAKPEERTNVLAGIDQAKKDVQFRQGQEERFTQFRQQQDKKRIDRQQANEATNISFRQGQEDAFTQFRQRQELVLLQFRRNQEDLERTTREKEEEAQLQVRLGREDKLLARRKENEQLLRNFQDNLENAATDRQIAKINAEAAKQVQDRLTEAFRQGQEVFDQAQIQIDEQGKEVDRTLRNIQNALDDIKDSLPADVLASVQGTLDRVQANITTTSAKVKQDFKDIQEGAKLNIAQAQAVNEAELTIRAPTPLQLQQQIPIQTIAAQSILAASVILPPGFSEAVSQAVFNGFQQASDRGLLAPDVTLDSQPIVDSMDRLNRFFGA